MNDLKIAELRDALGAILDLVQGDEFWEDDRPLLEHCRSVHDKAEPSPLYVAAPELLEALKACEAALANLRKNNRWDVHPEDFNDDVDEAVDAQEQARRVIARAEGRAE